MVNTERFVPSPTGDFHLGDLRTAILAWTWVRMIGRRFVLRIKNIDHERTGSAEHQIEDLAAVGVNWDSEPFIQVGRADAHEAALVSLSACGLVFEYYYARCDIRKAAFTPHVPPGHYPGACLTLSEVEYSSKRVALVAVGRAPALRLVTPSPEWTVFDELYGSYIGVVNHFVVRRADDVSTYDLAAVADDMFQSIDQAVRGFDLLSRASAQTQLIHLLGTPKSTYTHVPLAFAPLGTRLAKRDGTVILSDLRGLGQSTKGVVSFIEIPLGAPRARCASDIADALGIPGLRFLPTEPWVVTLPSP